jgi:hypothetical protein
MRLLKLGMDHPQVVFGPDAAWFRVPGAPSVHIARRKHLRRLLVALANQRQRAPGTVLPVTEMFEAGWPGDRAIAKAAATRVYTAIHALRTLGLGEALVRRNGGYALEAEVEWANDTLAPPPVASDAESGVYPFDELLVEAG